MNSRRPVRAVSMAKALAIKRGRQRRSNRLSDLYDVNWHKLSRTDVLALQASLNG
jgi:hypothetical protein